MQLLAARLDAVVYSLGLARTRRQARQLVGHSVVCLFRYIVLCIFTS